MSSNQLLLVREHPVLTRNKKSNMALQLIKKAKAIKQYKLSKIDGRKRGKLSNYFMSRHHLLPSKSRNKQRIFRPIQRKRNFFSLQVMLFLKELFASRNSPSKNNQDSSPTQRQIAEPRDNICKSQANKEHDKSCESPAQHEQKGEPLPEKPIFSSISATDAQNLSIPCILFGQVSSQVFEKPELSYVDRIRAMIRAPKFGLDMLPESYSKPLPSQVVATSPNVSAPAQPSQPNKPVDRQVELIEQPLAEKRPALPLQMKHPFNSRLHTATPSQVQLNWQYDDELPVLPKLTKAQILSILYPRILENCPTVSRHEELVVRPPNSMNQLIEQGNHEVRAVELSSDGRHKVREALPVQGNPNRNRNIQNHEMIVELGDGSTRNSNRIALPPTQQHIGQRNAQPVDWSENPSYIYYEQKLSCYIRKNWPSENERNWSIYDIDQAQCLLCQKGYWNEGHLYHLRNFRIQTAEFCCNQPMRKDLGLSIAQCVVCKTWQCCICAAKGINQCHFSKKFLSLSTSQGDVFDALGRICTLWLPRNFMSDSEKNLMDLIDNVFEEQSDFRVRLHDLKSV